MSLFILKAGMLDTIQDNGRYGYAHWGINPGGSMDRYAAQVANMLVGNDPGEAVLEIHFPGPQVLFEQPVLMTITGADFTALLDGVAIPRWQPIVVKRNSVLHFECREWGARCYLALHGGIHIDPWLGSRSTSLHTGMGGFEGRKLQKGDRLYLGESRLYVAGWLPLQQNFKVLPWIPDIRNMYNNPYEISMIPGHEWSLLSPESRAEMLQNNFIVHPRSDRMGYQLKGSPLSLSRTVELLSSGVQMGTVQLLPNGQLVILMSDHQTTGGYPRIGYVIAAHWPRLAQLRPSDPIHFSLTDMRTAEHLYCTQQKEQSLLQRACYDHLKQWAWRG